jgi:FixJ family two-component response regulator
LVNLIRSLGYEALAFSRAEEFLADPGLEDTSCLITDMLMPGMNGLELLDELATRRLHLPVIFVTGYPDERAELAGAIGFFGKPFDSRALIDCLEAALRLR